MPRMTGISPEQAPPEVREVFDGQMVTAGSVIVRQRGTPIHAGDNVGRGGDDTLFAKVDGTVKYGRRKGRRQVSVLGNGHGA